MVKYIKSLYKDIKISHLGQRAVDVPERYHSSFVHLGGGAEQMFILSCLIAGRGAQKILVVGVYGGRDFWGCRVLGHQVEGMDLAIVEDCSPTVAADAEKTWPMADASFDIVIMGEILEHCLHDAAVLYEAKRVLRPNGALIVTVPFWSHNDPTHIRTHSPQSIQRLLNCCGFEIEEYVERPGIPFLWILNYTIFPFALVYYYLCNKSLYVHIIKIVGKVNFVLGRSRLPRRLIGIFGLINWGCTIKAKVGKVYKYKEANIATFIR